MFDIESFRGRGYSTAMKVALLAKVTVDARRLLTSRWVHDTAHVFVSAKRKIKETEDRKPRYRRQ